jgi:hypothetical protein
MLRIVESVSEVREVVDIHASKAVPGSRCVVLVLVDVQQEWRHPWDKRVVVHPCWNLKLVHIG